MELFCLGSSSSGNAYVFKQDNDCLLVECGFEFAKLVKKLHSRNIALTDIKAVVVTHEHNDHSKALNDLENYGIQNISFKNTDNNNQNQLLQHSTKFSLCSFPVCHDVPAFGYSITNTDTNEKILFINDTSCLELPQEIKDTKYDYIFIECNHVRKILRELIEQATDEHRYKLERQLKYHLSLAGTKKMLSYLDLSNTKAIYLMHLSQEASDPKLMQQVVESTFKIKTYICKREGDFE